MNAKAKTQDVAVLPQQTPDRLIALAIEHGADVDRLGKLMDLQERWEARQARAAFYESLAAFQAARPPIPKSKAVKNNDGSVRYKYAPLDTICKVLAQPLRDHGFSYRWQTQHLDDGLSVTCYLTHQQGHEEHADVRIPAVTGFGTNDAQDAGSAITYGKRYSLANVSGITIDEDDDGASSGPENSYRLLRHNETLRFWLASVMAIKDGLAEGGDVSAAAEAYAEIPRPALLDLNVAPSKGGIWTTEERKTLNRDQEFQAIVHAIRKDSGWYDNPENSA